MSPNPFVDASHDPDLESLCRRVYAFLCKHPGVSFDVIRAEFGNDCMEHGYVFAVAVLRKQGMVTQSFDAAGPYLFWPVGDSGYGSV